MLRAFGQAFGLLVDKGLQLKGAAPLDIHIDVVSTPSSIYGPFEFHVCDDSPAVESRQAVESTFGLGKPPGVGTELQPNRAGLQFSHHVLAFVKAKSVLYVVLLTPEHPKHVQRVATLCRGVGGVISWVSGTQLREFVKLSNAQTEQQLLDIFDAMPDTGMKYIIYNLKNQIDFDVTSDPVDVKVSTGLVNSPTTSAAAKVLIT
eukprot:391585-Prorocentrum_minimum.AAC.5